MHTNRTGSFFITLTLFALLAPFSFAEAAGSLTIQSVSPANATVSYGQTASFAVVASGFSSPYLSISDDFGTNLIGNLNAQGNFSWTPLGHDVGTHNITISATDGAGNSASASQVITVIAPSVTLATMVNGPTAYVGKPMTFQVTPVGFTNPSYWLGDTISSTLNNSKLNASGAFYWVPTLADIGTHKMTVSVSDQFGHYVDVSQDVTVSPTPVPQVTSLSPGTTTPVGGVVTFTVTSPGYDAPTYTIHDSYSPSTIGSDTITTAGLFTWTPVRSQEGTHNIRITVSGTNNTPTDVTQTIVVQSALLSIEKNAPDSAMVGTPVKFAVNMQGLHNPVFALSDTFSGTITNNNISSSGYFIWTPTSGDVGSHNIGINATDDYGNAASVRKDIKILPAALVVTPPTPAPATQTLATPSVTSTPASSGYYFTKALAIGSVGAEVTALQTLLVKLGFLTTTPTGTFGPMTSAAVKKFQTASGLSPVGSVGPATRAKLNAQGGGGTSMGAGTTAAFRFSLPLAVGASGTEVSELQKKLTSLGYYSGVVNGSFDALTVAAVKKFQAAKGLEQVGSVGPGTRAALNAS